MATQTRSNDQKAGPETVLIIEGEVLIRSSLAEYLRSCGYRVVEAANADEAALVFNSADISVDIVLADAKCGFSIAHWVRQNRPDVAVIMTGTVQRAAGAAAELCEDGPDKKRPYDHQQLEQEIKRSLAKRARRE
jgi:DNA-binding NtrC family response regulator